MAALRELFLCWDNLAPRRLSSLVAAATERFGHIEWVARKIPELPGWFDLNCEMAAVRRRPPGKEADQAWASLMIRTGDTKLAMSWLGSIWDPFAREQALIHIAENASDRDMDEAMRTLSMLSFQWAFIQGLAAISLRRGIQWADPAGAEHGRHARPSTIVAAGVPSEKGVKCAGVWSMARSGCQAVRIWALHTNRPSGS